METGDNGQMIRRNPYSCMVEIFADGSNGGFFWEVACCSWELQREALSGQNKSSRGCGRSDCTGREKAFRTAGTAYPFSFPEGGTPCFLVFTDMPLLSVEETGAGDGDYTPVKATLFS